MASEKSYGYGTPNWDMIGRWLELPPESDGPFWALNLMKYRPVADYGLADHGGAARRGGSDTPPVSGREADDAYAPLGPLAAIGAVVAFHGDVVAQLAGDPHWDRVGIVRYPTRRAFFEMQRRDDFKEKHVHKEAGMEFTIVLSCLPEWHGRQVPAEGPLVVTVQRGGNPARRASTSATFAVEGVIVGDERRFDTVHFDRVAGEAGVAAIARDATQIADEAHVVVVEPTVDNLVTSIVTAPATA